MLTTATPVCKVWPNGEFTVGLDASRRMSEHHVQEVDPTWGRFCLAIAEAYGCKEQLIQSTQQAKPLDSSSVPNRPKRGKNGITAYGRRMVRNAAHWLQERYGKERLSFATLTLPSMSQTDNEAVVKNWSLIIKGLFKELGRLLQKRGLPDHYVCVTEIQEKRYETRGEFALHLHFVYVGRLSRKHGWATRPVEIRNIWAKNVQKYCVESYDFSSSENLTRVRKDASKYLGKYLSKGGKVLETAIKELPAECIPTAWYSIRRALGRAIKQAIRHYRHIARALTRARIDRRLAQSLSWIAPITYMAPDGAERICGFVGQFKRTFSSQKTLDSIELLLAKSEETYHEYA